MRVSLVAVRRIQWAERVLRRTVPRLSGSSSLDEEAIVLLDSAQPIAARREITRGYMFSWMIVAGAVELPLVLIAAAPVWFFGTYSHSVVTRWWSSIGLVLFGAWGIYTAASAFYLLLVSVAIRDEKLVPRPTRL